MFQPGRRTDDLLLLNLVLQLFDAVATYQGIQIGWKEANPILQHAFELVGVGPALLLFKAKACGLLVLLNRKGQHPLAAPALSFTASIYCLFSLAPWLAKFAVMFAQSI
jgi:hypothetical protein